MDFDHLRVKCLIGGIETTTEEAKDLAKVLLNPLVEKIASHRVILISNRILTHLLVLIIQIKDLIHLSNSNDNFYLEDLCFKIKY